MGFITGERAAINGITCLRKWKLTTSNKAAKAICSASKGGQLAAVGNSDWNGVALAYGGTPTVFPGNDFSFLGSLRTGSAISGKAIVDKIQLVIDVENADIVYYFIYFSGREDALTTGALQTDNTAPGPVSAKGLYLGVGAGTQAIRSAKVEIECANAEFVDSSTQGVVNRKRGNYKGMFTYSAYTDSITTLDALKGTYVDLKFNVNTGGTNWNFKWAFIEDVELDVNIEGEQDGRAVGVGYSASGIWSAYNPAGDIGTLTVAGTPVWPATYT